MIPKVIDPGILRGMQLSPDVLQQKVTDVALESAAKPKLGLLGLLGLGALGTAGWLWWRSKR